LPSRVFEFDAAAVDVADDVEGSGLRALVVEQARSTDQLGRVDLVGVRSTWTARKPPGQPAQRPLEVAAVGLMT